MAITVTVTNATGPSVSVETTAGSKIAPFISPANLTLSTLSCGTFITADGTTTLTLGDTSTVFSEPVTISDTLTSGTITSNATKFDLTDATTNSSSVYGPTIELYRNGGEGDASSTFLTNADKLGTIDFYGNNDAGTPEKIKYAKIFSTIYEETDGAESGRLSFSVINAGTLTEGANPATILDLEPDVAQFNSTVRLKAAASGGVQATSTPILELYQEDGPQADDGDHLGEIQFTALNNNNYSPIKHKYAGIHAEIIDESNATEDGSLHFTAVTAGTEDTTVLTLNGTESTFNSPVKVAVGPITINSNTANADLVITNSEASSADASPIIELFRSYGSNGNSDGDDIGKLEFYGSNDRGLSSGGPEKTLFASMFTEVVDSSDGTEDGQIKFTAIKAGSATDVLTLNGTESTFTAPLVVTGGLTASQTIANAVTDTDISVSEFATYNGKKIIYTGGAGSVHLADAVAADIGKAWTIINSGTGAITVNRATSSQTIKLLNGSSISAGSANLTVATGGIIEIICTAADNYIAFGSGIS